VGSYGEKPGLAKTKFLLCIQAITHPESYFVNSDTLVDHSFGGTGTSKLSILAMLEVHSLLGVWVDSSNVAQDL
jgi:hypothetical protein